jgi:hypothetical protein
MKTNSGNNPAICQITGVSSVNNVVTDTVGNLIAPDAFNGVNVYTGPPCADP